MHSIAWNINKTQPQKELIYLSAEKFMYLFIKSLRFHNAVSFKEQFRSVDVLMIDDLQFIIGKESTQEEFFHTFNALLEQKSQIIISADTSPFNLKGIEEKLKSRLSWGLVADINKTDYELRLGILQSKIKILGLDVPVEVVDFLASKITSNIRELEGAITRIVAYSTLIKHKINLKMAKNVLKDLLNSKEKLISIEEIQKKVSKYYNICQTEMHSAKKKRSIARARQVAMFLSKILTTHSLLEIGRKFGGRDHTTVIHAIKKIEELRNKDSIIREDIDHLVSNLKI